jgi:hypothetical protein
MIQVGLKTGLVYFLGLIGSGCGVKKNKRDRWSAPLFFLGSVEEAGQVKANVCLNVFRVSKQS